MAGRFVCTANQRLRPFAAAELIQDIRSAVFIASALLGSACRENVGPSPAPPLPPYNLIATAVSDSEIDLTWQDNSANAGGFQVERAIGGATSFAEIAVVQP